MKKPHIIIIGGGFGGIYTAKGLVSRVQANLIDVTLINRSSYFLFTPLLHEVATAGLDEKCVEESLEKYFIRGGLQVLWGEVASIDRFAKYVTVDGKVLAYDYLVVATGAETHYYGIPGAREYTLPLKTVEDAVRIRTRIPKVIELAHGGGNQASIVVVGAGATGVELAAEIAEFAKFLTPQPVPVTLVGAEPELLMMFHSVLRDAAKKRLEKMGIVLHFGVPVKTVTAEGIEFADGSRLFASLVVWAAGVKAVAPPFLGSDPVRIDGRLAVDDALRLRGDANVFAIGDTAAFRLSENSCPLPMLAQVAVGQAKIVARNILASIDGRPLQKFHYHSKGTLISLGRWRAVGEIFSIRLTGPVAWWAWRTVYLFKTVTWGKRLRVAAEWTVDIFRGRRVHKKR